MQKCFLLHGTLRSPGRVDRLFLRPRGRHTCAARASFVSRRGGGGASLRAPCTAISFFGSRPARLAKRLVKKDAGTGKSFFFVPKQTRKKEASLLAPGFLHRLNLWVLVPGGRQTSVGKGGESPKREGRKEEREAQREKGALLSPFPAPPVCSIPCIVFASPPPFLVMLADGSCGSVEKLQSLPEEIVQYFER